MNIFRFFLVLVSLCAIISVLGSGISEELPVMTTVVSGGKSTITESEPGAFLVQIQNITPNATVSSGNRTVQVSVPYALPAHEITAAIHLVDHEGKVKTFLIKAGDIRFFEENQTLVFDTITEEFYESTPFVSEPTTFVDVEPGMYTETNVSFADFIKLAENTPNTYCCTFDQVENKGCTRPLCGY